MFTCVAFCMMALSLHAAFSSTITGTIKIGTPPPKRVALNMSADPYCAQQHQGEQLFSNEMVTDEKGHLMDAFVYLKEGSKIAHPKNEMHTVTLDQRGCRYFPHVFGVQVNQTITILNSDSTLHNVHSLAKTNSNFNMGMSRKGQKIERKFTKPEIMVPIKCDVHGWMKTFVGVLEHPFFGVTDSSGRFAISGVPPGEYTVEIWHQKLGEKTQKVKVPETGEPDPLEVSF